MIEYSNPEPIKAFSNILFIRVISKCSNSGVAMKETKEQLFNG